MSLDHFIRLADSLVEFEADYEAGQYPTTSLHAIDIHRQEVKTTWSRIKSAYEKYLFDRENDENKADGENNDEGDRENPVPIESFQKKFKSTYITYCNLLALLNEAYESKRLQTLPKVDISTPLPISRQSEVTPNVSQTQSNSHSFRLPPCDIAVFNGDYLSWPTFRDMFSAVYIKNSNLSPVERLFHLINKTTGEAQEIAQKSPLTNQGFDLAWKSLCARFENRKSIVFGQLDKLWDLKKITSESSEDIKQLQRELNSCITTLELYDIDVKIWDPLFVYICYKKLPEFTHHLWEQGIEDKAIIPKWSDFDKFLTNRYRTLESVSEMRASNDSKSVESKTKSSNPPKSLNPSKKVSSFQTKVSEPKCQICPDAFHIIRKCPKFLQMNYNQRYSEIKKQSLCLNCFSKTHAARNCSSKNSCQQCGKRHNTLLHREFANYNNTDQLPSTSASSSLNPNSAPFSNRSNSNSIQSTNSSGANVVQNCFAINSRGVLLGTAIVYVCHLDMRYKARALIDSGSEGTFISERLFNTLKLPAKRTNAQISGLNNTISAKVQRECSFVLNSPFDDDVEMSVNALVVPHLAGNLPSQPVDASTFSNLPQIQLADPEFFKSSKIDILIGGDIFPSIMLSGIKHDVCGSLMAQETIFGWILTGPVSSNSSSISRSRISSYFCEISLAKEISRFWEVENLPRKNFTSQSDKFCEDLYVKTTKRDMDGRYIVSLPFKDRLPENTLGQSRVSAMAQFFRNESKLLRNPIFKQEYDEVVQEYIHLNHMFRVSSPDSVNLSQCYYLPHHAVIKPESKTTKVRVVFNASSPSSNGLSLNDILHIGPSLQSDLTLLILKWRFFRFVFNADIQKMYRQILIHPEHTPFQRILFRSDPHTPIQDFELKTVTFGVNCAPYLAIRTILQLADDVESSYPIASNILRNNMYVDDALAGAHSVSEAIKAKNQLILALQSAGFSLRKWTSNSKDIIEDLPPDHLLNEDFLDFDDSSTAKTLGIRWNARSDLFYFTTKPFSESSKFTKREVLSQIAKLFDPAGWLSPCVVLAKILMQRIWIEGTDWDEVLSQESISHWKMFQSNYSGINDIQIPRWIDFSPNVEVQFHGFCDASEKAYAAALYIRISNSNSISTHLVSAKSRVAPVKTLSIPRLELCGAVLLAEMIDSLIPKLDVDMYSISCWTDSTIVLSWLAKPPCVWLTFVANRVSRIVEIIDPSHWYHVSSENNPADLASRGCFPQELIQNELWWHGPQFLKDADISYQDSPKIPELDLEKKPIKVHFAYFQNFDDILDRFSSYSRAMRVLAYIYRFYFRTHKKFRSSFCRESRVVTSSEIIAVRDTVIRMSQKACYPNEYQSLSCKKSVAPSSSILSLNPFLDPEGIIRSCGRLEFAPGVSYHERHPIIIPYNCQYTRLLVKFVHDITIHGGNQLMLRVIRSQYWIPKVKNLIKTTINKCKPCILYKKRCQQQIMAALPPERSEFTRPFTHTGLDFAGPFDIKSYAGRTCRTTKGYVCVFVCFSTKAIHLEVTSDLSTPAFLAAFNRFVSRRGCPLHLHSDNGTTFVGASKILAREFIQTSHQAVNANYAHQNISWHFIPPGAPHMGGLWEAGVKSFKLHFRKVAGGFKYTFEEFSTLLSRIEACLNSRPLSPMSQDPSDLLALTPGHFLIGSPILEPIDPTINEKPMSIRNRWQRLKLLNQHFCIRWKNEYLRELQKRVKWQKPEEDLKPNTLVVIKEENLPPTSWRLGRITKVYLGSDNRVRVADVYTQKGLITRPITKLVVLSLEL